MTRVISKLGRCLAVGALLAACSSVDSRPAVTVRAEPLRGEMQVASLTIPEGTALGYDTDLVVDSGGDITIAGSLNGLARPAGESAVNPDGANLTLRSATQIVISGSVTGAPGRDGRVNPETLRLLGLEPSVTPYDPEQIDEQLRAYLAEHGAEGIDVTIFDGGRGGDVRLIAPKIVVNLVRAGRAGNGGPGGNGGAGGTVRTTPVCVAWQPGAPGCFGGEAGLAGQGAWGIRDGRGGNGGAGGGALGGSLAYDD